MSTSTSVDASALQEKSYSHKPPTRKPSDRLREKIQRESCARVEGDKALLKVETIDDGYKEMKMSVDDEGGANVASKDSDKVKLQLLVKTKQSMSTRP